jgi:hypothetical protein
VARLCVAGRLVRRDSGTSWRTLAIPLALLGMVTGN